MSVFRFTGLAPPMMPPHRPRRTPLRSVFVALAMLVCALATNAAEPAKTYYNLPAGNAGEALKRFAAQANREIVFSGASVRGVKTNAVRGELTAADALERMLAGTGLVATVDAKTGAFAVRPEAPPEKNVALRPVPRKPAGSHALMPCTAR